MGCAVVMENEMSTQEAYKRWECDPYGEAIPKQAFTAGYEAGQSPLREMYEARHAAALKYADEIVKLRSSLCNVADEAMEEIDIVVRGLDVAKAELAKTNNQLDRLTEERVKSTAMKLQLREKNEQLNTCCVSYGDEIDKLRAELAVNQQAVATCVLQMKKIAALEAELATLRDAIKENRK
jgi:chromosome segregation ATPase